jgi:hypothetical protein
MKSQFSKPRTITWVLRDTTNQPGRMVQSRNPEESLSTVRPWPSEQRGVGANEEARPGGSADRRSPCLLVAPVDFLRIRG